MNSLNSISNNFKKLKNMTAYEIIFVVVILLYLLSNVSTPYALAPYINNTYTYFSLIAIVLFLFLKTNPLIAIFFGIAAAIFISRSSKVDHKVMAPSSHNKSINMINLNNTMKAISLEEELISVIQKQPDNILNTNSYHPVSCETHNASSI